MRLDVGEAAFEQLRRALDGEPLGDVDPIASAVVAPTHIPFGVFVGHHRARRLQDRLGDDILGGDQFDLIALPVELAADRGENFRIRLGEIGLEKRVEFGEFGGRIRLGHERNNSLVG